MSDRQMLAFVMSLCLLGIVLFSLIATWPYLVGPLGY